MHSNNVKNKGMKSKGAKSGRGAVSYAGRRPEVEILFLVGVVVAMLLLVSPAMAREGEAKIRMAHLSPDAPAVMVELDGEPVEALASVSYRDSTPYMDIPAGPHDVAVFAAADPSEPVLEVSIAPEAGQSYTVAGVGLLGDETFGARLFEDDATEPKEGKARVRVIHAIPDVGPATVGVEDGPDLFALPGFANASDYAGVDAGTYTLDVTPAGAAEPAFNVPDVELEEGEIYTAFAIGQASEGTIDTTMTVDSDDGRVVGPHTLEDTSGDLSLLEGRGSSDPDPQPERASTSNTQNEEQSEAAASSNPDSTKGAAEKAPPKNIEPESAAQPEAPVETYQAPAPVSEPAYVPTYEPVPVATEPAEQIAVPTVEEIAPEPLVSDAGFVPQPVQTAQAAVPQGVAVPQEVPVSQAPVPQVEIPTVEITPVSQIPVPQATVPTVETLPVPQVPAVSGSWSSQTMVSTQTVASSTNGVVAEGFAPSAPPVQTAAAQNVSRQVGGGGVGPVPVVHNPADSVVGFVTNTPAVVNSGARRKFVTIRSKGRSLPSSG